MTSGLTFRVVVVGEFGGWLAHYAGAATLTAENGCTTLVGRLERPEMLHALTDALCDLGLEIESARMVV